MEDILHIYGQEAWHDDVKIVGTQKALEMLKDEIEKTLKKSNKGFQTWTNDGEGFWVRIKLVEEDSLEFDEMPYSAHYAR